MAQPSIGQISQYGASGRRTAAPLRSYSWHGHRRAGSEHYAQLNHRLVLKRLCLFQLLEEHLEQLRTEGKDGTEDEDAGWEGWDAQSDSSESSSTSWIDVESDNEDIYVSDSDNDGPANKKEINRPDDGATPSSDKSQPMEQLPASNLATTKVRSPFHLVEPNVVLTQTCTDINAG